MCNYRLLLLSLFFSAMPGVETRLGAPLALVSCGVSGVIAAYIVSTLTGFLVYLLLERLENMLREKIPRAYALYSRFRRRLARRAGGVTSFLGVIGFVAVPLPGSGVWSGAILARLLGLGRLEALAALALGNMITVLIVTAAAALLSTTLP